MGQIPRPVSVWMSKQYRYQYECSVWYWYQYGGIGGIYYTMYQRISQCDTALQDVLPHLRFKPLTLKIRGQTFDITTNK